MPILKFKAIEAQKICSISKQLVDELQVLLECPRDYFTLEVAEEKFIRDGEFVDGNPVIKISWFDRGQEIQDKVAEKVTKYVNGIGYENVDIIFTVLEENKYYENGKHF
ncbi:DUF1904 domain-containing protein [Clostridium gasigenes]|uniref:DUF1904 family protein n=1 Tax=Clostridium gasigenes TaxID=94869 RepID=UPI001C0D0A59|nr:DUF1904 family protein [Clostridium gasigenes]MBU3136191.1 DUF1904 domain-containing protein [Clostridium gasigenes]